MARMSLLRLMDRRARWGARVVVAVASGLGVGAALASALGAGCSSAPFQYCDVQDGMALPPICIPPVKDAGESETGEAGDIDADAAPLVDAGDAAASSLGCAGPCWPAAPLGFGPPLYVWIGPDLEAQTCPTTTTDVYEGYADLSAPPLCGPCACNPPVGSCEVPATLTAQGASCAETGPTTPTKPFDPPSGWDGGCTTDDAIDGGQPCDSGVDGGLCVQSVTVASLTISELGCTPMQGPVTQDPPTWGLFARACEGSAAVGCTNGNVCSPPMPSAAEFHTCVSQLGDNECSYTWDGPYTEKHLFYQGFQDNRSCSPCTCGSPAGASCTSEVTVYSDDHCMSPPVVSVLAGSEGPECLGVIPGSALGSKTASSPTYSPGACLPGGGPAGSAEPVGPMMTFCCIP